MSTNDSPISTDAGAHDVQPSLREEQSGRGRTTDLLANNSTPEVQPPPVTSPLDHVFYGLSSAADHGLLWLLIGAVRSARRGDPRLALRLGAVMGAESALTNGVVKSFFRRLRPDRGDGGAGPLPYGMHRPITSSFPSGHAASAFTAATVLSDSKRAAMLLYPLAALVAYSRVHTKMHHGADVIAGAGLGLAFGALARMVLPLDAGAAK